MLGGSFFKGIIMGSVVLAGATSGSTTITPTDAVTATVTLPSTGGTLQTSGAGFTTNGVAYASSTSALATGSTLYFDGTSLGIGTNTLTGFSGFRSLELANSSGNAISLVTGTGVIAETIASNSNSLVYMGSRSNHPLLLTTNDTERARIDTSGNLLVGTTTANGRLTVFAPTGSAPCYFKVATNGDAGIFFANASNTIVGQVQVNSSSTAYVTSSDYRLKNTIAPMTGALAKVAQLKPVTYKWKVDGSDGQGFIAHELQAIVPECVTGEKDGVDEDGNPRYQGIDTSFLVATLTSAIQELSTLITAQSATIQSLTERITALENK